MLDLLEGIMAVGTALDRYFRNGRAVESRPWHSQLNLLVRKLTSRRWVASSNPREYGRTSLLLMRAYALTPDHFAYSNVGERNWTEYLVQDARIRYDVVKAECGVA